MNPCLNGLMLIVTCLLSIVVKVLCVSLYSNKKDQPEEFSTIPRGHGETGLEFVSSVLFNVKNIINYKNIHIFQKSCLKVCPTDIRR